MTLKDRQAFRDILDKHDRFTMKLMADYIQDDDDRVSIKAMMEAERQVCITKIEDVIRRLHPLHVKIPVGTTPLERPKLYVSQE